METVLSIYYILLAGGMGWLLRTRCAYQGDGILGVMKAKRDGDLAGTFWHVWLIKPAFIGAIFCYFFASTLIRDIGNKIVAGLFLPIFYGYALGVLVLVLRNYGLWPSVKRRNVQHNKGAQTATIEDVNRMVRDNGEAVRLTLGGLKIPQSIEGRNFILAGAPGSGKTQAINELLDQLQDYSDRVFITDPSGQFLKRYFRKGEVIFNPFDKRSVDWSPLAEMDGVWSADTLAKSMIPDAEGAAKEWNGYAQTLLSSILRYLLTSNNATNGELYRLACIAGTEELRKVVVGTAAQSICEEGNERLLGSVRSIASSYLQAVKYLNPKTGRDGFSFTKHVSAGKGWVYLTYNQQQLASIKPLIACALDVVSLAILSLEPDLNRQKIWIYADEFPLLGRIQNLEVLATNGRKHGAAIVLGFQAQAQIVEAYGQLGAKTLLNCMQSCVVLRCPDQETAKYWSEHAGKEEVTRIQSSGGHSSSGVNTGWSTQTDKPDVIMQSEIQKWPDLFGYCNLAGAYPIVPMELNIAPNKPAATESFIQADMQPETPPVTVSPAAAEEGLTKPKPEKEVEITVDI